MAKNKSDDTTQAEVQETAGAAVAAPEVVSDDRFKKIRVDGVEVNRKDYILKLWQENKMSRGSIAKHLTELNSVENGGTGKKIAYQIVFATTKGKPGGPDKPVEGAVPTATS